MFLGMLNRATDNLVKYPPPQKGPSIIFNNIFMSKQKYAGGGGCKRRCILFMILYKVNVGILGFLPVFQASP